MKEYKVNIRLTQIIKAKDKDGALLIFKESIQQCWSQKEVTSVVEIKPEIGTRGYSLR